MQDTVYSRYIAVVYIAESDISRLHVGPHFFAHLFREFYRHGAQARHFWRYRGNPKSRETEYTAKHVKAPLLLTTRWKWSLSLAHDQSPDISRSHLYRGTIPWTPTTAIYREYTVPSLRSLFILGTFVHGQAVTVCETVYQCVRSPLQVHCWFFETFFFFEKFFFRKFFFKDIFFVEKFFFDNFSFQKIFFKEKTNFFCEINFFSTKIQVGFAGGGGG